MNTFTPFLILAIIVVMAFVVAVEATATISLSSSSSSSLRGARQQQHQHHQQHQHTHRRHLDIATTTTTDSDSIPTITLAPTTDCFDDDTLRYKDVKQCKWVGLDAPKRCALPWQNTLLHTFCPLTCGLCVPITAAPTQLPTQVPTTAPSSSPSMSQAPTPVPTTPEEQELCLDDPFFIYKKQRKCTWVAKEDTAKRCSLSVSSSSSGFTEGKVVIKNYCPETCGLCDGTEPPSQSPTTLNQSNRCADATTTSPFRLELGIDNFGEETSWQIIMQDDDGNGTSSIVGEGSIDRYKRNQQYIEYVCVPKNKRYTFVINDQYGDGLIANQNGYYRGYLNNQELFAGGDDFFSEKSIPFHTTVVGNSDRDSDIFLLDSNSDLPPSSSPSSSPSVPPTPSSCFDEDDTTFRYKGQPEKNCDWLQQYSTQKKGRKRCHKKDPQGQKIWKKSCPTTCGVTFGIGKCRNGKK